MNDNDVSLFLVQKTATSVGEMRNIFALIPCCSDWFVLRILF